MCELRKRKESPKSYEDISLEDEEKLRIQTEKLEKEQEEIEEEKVKRHRESEKRDRDPWRRVHAIFHIRLAYYKELAKSFPQIGLFWLKVFIAL